MPRRPPLDFEALGRALEEALLRGPASAGALRSALEISQPSLSRLVNAHRDELVVIGRTRGTRYALRRAIPGVVTPVPLYEIGADAGGRHVGTLHPIWPEGYWFEGHVDDARSRMFEDLPWFLYDLRPVGFLGRLLPRRHPELGHPPDVRAWSAEHCLRYWTRHGWDLPGAFVLGDEAYARYLEDVRRPRPLVDAADRAEVYPRLASDVLGLGLPGSSAAGEQPKFLVTRGPAPTPVLVKFSPVRDTPVARRVADLLVCEHLALETLRELAPPAPRSQLLDAGGRTFLEVERFDRAGRHGRRGVVSLLAADAEHVGRMQSWTDTAEHLARQRVLSEDSVLRVRWLDVFGALTASSDRHHGNLSLFSHGTRLGDVCPPYDLCPMAFAPRGHELHDRPFVPPTPHPADAPVWQSAWTAALALWSAATVDPRISEGFRAIAAACLGAVEGLEAVGAALPVTGPRPAPRGRSGR